jgi:chlorobactene glucosyltransferase
MMGRHVRALTSLLSHLTALLTLAALTRRLWSNVRFLSWVRRQAQAAPTAQSHVSVLVPARNERATIAACVTSLLRQDYSTFDIVILDDASTDGTGVQLDRLAGAAPSLRIIHSDEPPPEDWNGKSYACSRLADHATGEWLLFTDADTRHTPQSVARGFAMALALDVHLLSVFPFQRTVTWSESLFVSFILDFLPLLGVNLKALWRGDSRTLAVNGQYLLVRASTYHSLGGHRAIGKEMVDDFALARRFLTCGRRIAFVDGGELLECRMYRNVRDVWEGFSKNLLLGHETATRERRSPWWGALFIWCFACLFVTPFSHLARGGLRWLAMIEIGWLLLLRGWAGACLKRPHAEIATTPVAGWMVMALGMSTLYRRWRRREIWWKERVYRG